MTTDGGRPTRRADLHVGPVGSDVLVLDPSADTLYELNDTARAVFDLCDGTRTVPEIAESLRDRYHAPDGQRLERDVEAVLHQLGELGLLETAEADGT